MIAKKESRNEGFGGPWTVEKLSILKGYLGAYTTALKSQPFSLMYVDAFAGNGRINTRNADPNVRSFLKGSARIAVDIAEKPFDKLIFVENDAEKCEELNLIKEEHSSRDIEIYQSDANDFLRSMELDKSGWRGVLFLDPFATEVEWRTVRAIANMEMLDTWLLFPVSAISRLLPRSSKPEDISSEWAACLTKVYGDTSWSDLYQPRPPSRQIRLIPLPNTDPAYAREPGVTGLLDVYKKNLRKLFGTRLLADSVALTNSNNATLFELIFCAGNPKPRAVGAAHRIAKYLMFSRPELSDLSSDKATPPRGTTCLID